MAQRNTLEFAPTQQGVKVTNTCMYVCNAGIYTCMHMDRGHASGMTETRTGQQKGANATKTKGKL